MPAPKTLARTVAFLYLFLFIGGLFNEVYVRPRVIKPGDITTTANNIRASATLFRLGFLSDFLAATSFLFIAMVLYLLLKHVNQLAAAAMVTLVAVSVAISSVNLLNQYTALTIATNEDYTRAFGQAGSDALAVLFASIYSNGWFVASMTFGLWLLPLGYLVIRSGYFPKFLGVLLIIGSFAHLAGFFTHFLAPDLSRSIGLYFTGPAAATELVFVAWLLIKGVRVPLAQQAPAPAVAATNRVS
jgi:Domain of unknown function (DUF4386)